MRVSVVGCGSISNNHLKALKGLHNVEISSVVDIRKDRADAAAKKYHCKAYYDFETMLSEDKPDSVHICTPHYLYVPMAVSALEKKFTFCAKSPVPFQSTVLTYSDSLRITAAQNSVYASRTDTQNL